MYLEALATVKCGEATIGISPHALLRYRERVKPGFDSDAALEDIQRLIETIGVYQDTRPVWVPNHSSRDAGWLELGPDVVFILRHSSGTPSMVATTCLTRHGLSDLTLEKRRARRARRTQRRVSHEQTKRMYLRKTGKWTE